MLADAVCIPCGRPVCFLVSTLWVLSIQGGVPEGVVPRHRAQVSVLTEPRSMAVVIQPGRVHAVVLVSGASTGIPKSQLPL